MKFFFDNNLAVRIARSLEALVSPEHQVTHWKDQFAAGSDDSVLMAQLGQQEPWVIITADPRIGQNPHEIEAWKQAGHTVFFLKPRWLNLTFWKQTQTLVECFPEIIRHSERADRGSAFFVSVGGKISRA